MTLSDCVVFGGAGFIGTHLLERLRSESSGRVISIDIREPKRKIDGVEYHIGDVAEGTFPELGISAPTIFNLAAVHTTPGHEPWEYYSTNVNGAIHVCRFARTVGSKKIVFTSSISVYGPDETPKDESTPPTPNSDYGRSKHMAEGIHDDWQRENPDHQLVIVRPAVVFGQGEGGNFTRLAKVLARGLFIFPGRRDTIKSCIYVETLTDWMLLAASKDQPRILFNGSYLNRYTIEQIVDAFREVAFPRVRKFTMPASVLKGIAAALRPISAATGLGIHPERITKLMVSTNVLPTWAEVQELTANEDITVALRDWAYRTGGKFN